MPVVSIIQVLIMFAILLKSRSSYMPALVISVIFVSRRIAQGGVWMDCKFYSPFIRESSAESCPQYSLSNAYRHLSDAVCIARNTLTWFVRADYVAMISLAALGIQRMKRAKKNGVELKDLEEDVQRLR